MATWEDVNIKGLRAMYEIADLIRDEVGELEEAIEMYESVSDESDREYQTEQREEAREEFERAANELLEQAGKLRERVEGLES